MPRVCTILVIALVGSSVLVGCTRSRAPARTTLPDGTPVAVATIDHVVDGDTVELAFAGRGSDRARLLGIDTPETVKPDAPVECFGPEASARAKELLRPGTEVLVQRDKEARDRYGRLLVYLWRRSDHLFINEALLRDGYARVLSISPNTSRRGELANAADDARSNGRGLWASCPPEG